MKKAVMYGGGNIGRGFIGATLSQSGYAVTFIDVAEPVVKALSENHQYPVRYVSTNGYEDVLIENVIMMCMLSEDPLGTYADVLEMSYSSSQVV